MHPEEAVEQIDELEVKPDEEVCGQIWELRQRDYPKPIGHLFLGKSKGLTKPRARVSKVTRTKQLCSSTILA